MTSISKIHQGEETHRERIRYGYDDGNAHVPHVHELSRLNTMSF